MLKVKNPFDSPIVVASWVLLVPSWIILISVSWRSRPDTPGTTQTAPLTIDVPYAK